MAKVDFTVQRECAGFYVVRVAGREGVAEVVRYSERNGDGFTGWIARVQGDRYAYSDPIPTKRDAVMCAIDLLRSE